MGSIVSLLLSEKQCGIDDMEDDNFIPPSEGPYSVFLVFAGNMMIPGNLVIYNYVHLFVYT